MADKSNIEWTDSTFNPWIGCTKVSPACEHCYAEVSTPSRTRSVKWGAGQPRQRTSAGNWAMPLRWNAKPFYACESCGWRGEYGEDSTRLRVCLECAGKLVPARRRVFCASLADVFDNEVPDQWRADLFALIEATPNLDWLLLTKRVGNVRAMAPLPWIGGPVQHGPDSSNMHGGWPANVWLGATICNQAEADRDIPKLLRVPAAVRFLSIEPMLGPIDLEYPESLYPKGPPMCCSGQDCGCRGQPIEAPMIHGVNWVIVGGESGPHARPMHPDWARSLRDQCAAAGVPFLFKQWGDWWPISRTDGRHELPFGEYDVHSLPPYGFIRRGKKAAGRELDGFTHNGYPVVCHG